MVVVGSFLLFYTCDITYKSVSKGKKKKKIEKRSKQKTNRSVRAYPPVAVQYLCVFHRFLAMLSHHYFVCFLYLVMEFGFVFFFLFFFVFSVFNFLFDVFAHFCGCVFERFFPQPRINYLKLKCYFSFSPSFLFFAWLLLLISILFISPYFLHAMFCYSSKRAYKHRICDQSSVYMNE